MKLRTMMVREYDGSLRQIVGTLEIKPYIGPQMFLVKLQVMDIHLSYSMLLERPCVMTLFFSTRNLAEFPLYFFYTKLSTQQFSQHANNNFNIYLIILDFLNLAIRSSSYFSSIFAQ